jgi:hypothetical protein
MYVHAEVVDICTCKVGGFMYLLRIKEISVVVLDIFVMVMDISSVVLDIPAVNVIPVVVWGQIS